MVTSLCTSRAEGVMSQCVSQAMPLPLSTHLLGDEYIETGLNMCMTKWGIIFIVWSQTYKIALKTEIVQVYVIEF